MLPVAPGIGAAGGGDHAAEARRALAADPRVADVELSQRPTAGKRLRFGAPVNVRVSRGALPRQP